MTKNRGRRTPKMASVSPEERVRIVLERLYAGNQSEMAKALDCSHSAVSQIVHRRRGVGAGLLRAIAALPGVSPEWAILGVGEPPAVLGGPSRAKLFLPVVTSLDFALTGFPALAQSSMAEHVTSVDYSPTRMIFQVPDAHPCLSIQGGRLKNGDHILFEADPRFWIRDPEFLHGRLCIIATPHANKRTAEVIRIAVKCGEVRVAARGQTDSRDARKKIRGRWPRHVQIDPMSQSLVGSVIRADSAVLETTDIIAASIRFWGVP